MSRLLFKVESEAADSNARAAHFETAHGQVLTPVFMPVGTQATVKSQTVDALKACGSQVLLANTFHLLLRPGPEVFQKLGGIHRFMNWSGPVLTDSGGFQIFSLPRFRTMDEQGARFQSYLDGKTHLLSPEKSIAMQQAIGSDIMMVLDQCIASTAEHAEAKAAMELTHRWAVRSLAARDSSQALFGIVQGACFEDLRRQSAQFLTSQPFDGFAVGGLAVGETKQQREDFTELTTALLPRDLPRYLMGVGTPLDILEAVHRGVDLFDCIIPSQLAQRGGAYTSLGKLQLRRGIYKFSEDPLDPQCPCSTCTRYSRAYLHHLHKAGESLGWTLLTTHNLTFYHQMMREIRESILQGRFAEYYKKRRCALALSDNSEPTKIVPAKKAARLGNYEIHASPKGHSSIRQISSQEVMHSVNNPIEEAFHLYIEQSDLSRRLGEFKSPLVIWDVGLGAATNAMAAIKCFEALQQVQSFAPRAMEIWSFEKDLDSLRLALKHLKHFPHLNHPAPHSLLEQNRWESACGNLTWTLRTGDFLVQMYSATVPDLIFYDPFSSKTDAELWTPETFAKIYRICAKHSTELYTYSASTAVRAALLCAGFFVARGRPTGPKVETTLALTHPPTQPTSVPLLSSDWLSRWSKSEAKFPGDFGIEARAVFEDRILKHAQFSEVQ